MAHYCHATGCTRAVRPEMFMCRGHWYQLPKSIRDEIWATYRPGQCDDKQPSVAYCQAAKTAVRFLAKAEGIEPDIAMYEVFEASAVERETMNQGALCDSAS